MSDDLSPSGIEAAARALHAVRGSLDWEMLPEEVQELRLKQARAALAAASGAAPEVETEYRAEWDSPAGRITGDVHCGVCDLGAAMTDPQIPDALLDEIAAAVNWSESANLPWQREVVRQVVTAWQNRQGADERRHGMWKAYDELGGTGDCIEVEDGEDTLWVTIERPDYSSTRFVLTAVQAESLRQWFAPRPVPECGATAGGEDTPDQGRVAEVREAALRLLGAADRMRDDWAEGDDVVKRGLWQRLHTAADQLHEALDPPAPAVQAPAGSYENPIDIFEAACDTHGPHPGTADCPECQAPAQPTGPESAG